MRAPCLALAMASAIAFAAVPPVRAQAVADPGRSPDAAFVAKASAATAVDAELSTLAVRRARTASVKAFAKQVVDTHTALAREFTAMGRTAPKDAAKADPPSPDAVKAVAALKSQPPADFDAAFVAVMIARREAAVALFEAESRDGRDAEVKEWAARQLPALRSAARCGQSPAATPEFVEHHGEDTGHEEAHSRRV